MIQVHSIIVVIETQAYPAINNGDGTWSLPDNQIVPWNLDTSGSRFGDRCRRNEMSGRGFVTYADNYAPVISSTDTQAYRNSASH